MGPLDKLYWIRAVLGTILGLISGNLGFEQPLGGPIPGIFRHPAFGVALIIYIATYYAGRFFFARKVPKEQAMKIFTSGVGTYFMLWLFLWILINTLREVSMIP